MDKIFKIIGMTDNEVKVYRALLKLKKGTKTPIVREAKVLSSKVYEILDRLIQKGIVTSFVEDNIKHYVPIHPDNIAHIFDDKIKELKVQKKEFTKQVKSLFPDHDAFTTDVQLFRGWNGLKNAFRILINDLKKKDTYYILGSTGGEDLKKAIEFFPKVVADFDRKAIQRKVLFQKDRKHEAELYFKKFGKKNWDVRYYEFTGPLEIGITNNYVMHNLLEKEPIITLIKNKKIADSHKQYFETMWKLAKE